LALRRAQPRSQAELRDLLVRLDGQHVELQVWKTHPFDRTDWNVGALDAAHVSDGLVQFTYATGERKTMWLDAIAYVIDPEGQRHGPYR
jgi:hypothetical protein